MRAPSSGVIPLHPSPCESLRRLVDWTAPASALVLSVHLDLRRESADGDPGERAVEACNALLEQQAREPGAEALAALVHPFLEGLRSQALGAQQRGYQGLVLFLCAEPRLQESVRLRFPVPTGAAIARRPRLRHLLALAEEYERALCVLVGPVSAKVCEVHLGDPIREREITSSQRRQMPQELAAMLARKVREDHLLHVILLGSPSDRDVVEEALSRDVVARVIGRVDQAPESDSPEFLAAVHGALQAYERRAEEEGVARLMWLRDDGQEVAVGLPATLSAINRGKLRTLFVLQSWAEPGWVCDACSYLGTLPAPPFCLACDAPVSVTPLEEHLLDQAAACGAEIETVKHSQVLADLGGVGALIDDPGP